MKVRSIVTSRALALAAAAISTSIALPAPSAQAACMPGQLRTIINQINSKFGRVQVISTHRPGARIRGSGKASYHASCRAVDFHPPRGKYGAVLAWLKSHHSGGIGTYSCNLHHIHIDTGPRVRWHKCQ